VAVLTANAEGYLAALDAFENGIVVAGVLDLRPQAHASEEPLLEALRTRGVAVHFGVRPVAAHEGAGRRVREIEFDVARDAGGSTRQRLTIDGVWMSVGFAPANQLLHQAGAKMRYEPAIEQFVPARLPRGLFACGKVAGMYELDDRLAHGRASGALAATDAGSGGTVATDATAAFREAAASVDSTRRGSPSHPYPIFAHVAGKEFVDLDEDLQIRDLTNAFQEGFDSSELLKRYSTVGMGPSQGKHSNLNAMRILARLREESVESVGPTTARPMFHPVPLAHLAGRGFHPHRRTPLHDEHEKLGAVWMPAGDWQRPEYYARAGETREACIEAEVRCAHRRRAHRCRYARQDRGARRLGRPVSRPRLYRPVQHAQSGHEPLWAAAR
jgi:sarcosine oxidase subunit alpha